MRFEAGWREQGTAVINDVGTIRTNSARMSASAAVLHLSSNSMLPAT